MTRSSPDRIVQAGIAPGGDIQDDLIPEPRMRRLLATLAVLTLAAPLAAQGTAPSPLGVFADLTGEWEGEAWIIMGPNGKHTLRQRESVAPAAGGTVVTVRGLGTERMPDGTDKVQHDAFAVIHFDHDGKKALMRAFTAYNWNDMDLTIRPDGYTWRRLDPRAGMVRYDMTLEGGSTWVEKGFASRDEGKT